MTETVVGRLLEWGRTEAEGISCYHKRDGRWVPIRWGDAARGVRQVAAGLASLGFQPGERASILSNTRYEWLHADLAIQAAGGVSVGIYATMSPEQVRYILSHSDSRFAVVENAVQLAKVRPLLGELPRLAKVIVIEPASLGEDERVMSLETLRLLGVARESLADERVSALRADDPALFVYTSGTTGPPKAAALAHRNVVAALRAYEVIRLQPEDVGMSFLPLAHVLQRIVDYRGLWTRNPGYYAESIERLQANLLEARPSVMAAVPRIFEKIYAAVQAQVALESPAKQRVFRWAMEIGRRVSERRVSGEPIPLALAIRHRVAKRLVFNKVRAKLGGRIRLFFTGGAPIAREILEFFHAADVEVLEGWGMSETLGAGSLNLPGAQRFGSIGRPLPGLEMKLDADGEILIRGPNVMKGYFGDDEANRASFTADGFFRTGDIGELDGAGFFRIVDRKKDLIITAGGKKIAPQNLENALKQRPFVSQAMCVGEGRPYVVALLTLDPAQLLTWAREQGLAEDLRQLARHPAAIALVQAAVDDVNRHLASFETIKKFRVVPEDFGEESGELTPTLKIRRDIVAKRYHAWIDEMYAERPTTPAAPEDDERGVNPAAP